MNEDPAMTATIPTERRELAGRTSDGITISLYWTKATNRVTIELVDVRRDERLEFDVPGAHALHAFQHPYAYVDAPAPDAGFASPTAVRP
jgi:hypothetical protein